MPIMDVRPLKENSNADILNAIRKNSSPDYQRRIPEATKANVQEVLQHLTDYRPGWNEFVDALINRIGQIIVRNNIWTNPLAKFKQGMMQNGDTIEEINVGLIKARVYNSDRLNLERDIFGQYPPEVQSAFHKLNRQEYYPITINEPLLMRAFLDNYGIQGFISAAMSAPTTSDQWDEFLITTSLIKEYHKAGGFFKVNVADVSQDSSTAEQAKNFLRKVRAYANTLTFLSTHYNPSGMPVAVNPEDLELIITPEALAAIDVEALAAAFNIDKANMPGRITVLPQENFGIEGAQAILTTKDYFVIADSRIETTSAWNPVSLSTNFFLHHWEILSVSKFVPAILFTSTEETTVITSDATPVTGVSALTVTDRDGDTVTDVERGELYQILGNAITTPDGGVNDAIRLELSGNESTRTYLTHTGVLHVSPDEESLTLTITGFAVDAAIGEYSNSVTVGVVGDKLTLWPNPGVETDSDLDGDFEVTPVELTLNEDDEVTIPEVIGMHYTKTISTGVTFTDAGDIVTVPSHGASVGDLIEFGAITSTTGVAASTEYYVKTVPSANTMTISATDGGATLALTTNGSAASATITLNSGDTHTVVSSTVFDAVLEDGYEFAAGVDTSWTLAP